MNRTSFPSRRAARSRAAAAVSAAAACALLLAFLPGCGENRRASAVQGVSVRALPSDRAAQEAWRLVNEQRLRRGMRALVRRADLDAVAHAHARDLLRMGRLSHTSSDGRQLENRLAKLDWEWAGENLARNKGFDSPAREAVRGWIASPKHYENMFRPDFNQTGMAALYDRDSGFTYFVQVFITPVM